MLRQIRIISNFLTIELGVQALGLISGLLLIRVLDKSEYAYFTIANSMQATMNLLADMGIGISLSALGGKVWQDKNRFGQLISTALKLRYYLAAISVTIVSPVLLILLVRAGASIAYGILITVFILVGLNFQLTSGVLEVVPRLHSQIKRIQSLNLFSNAARLVLLGISYLYFLNSAVAIAIMSSVLGFQRFIWGKWASENIQKNVPPDPEDQKFILNMTKNVAPNAIFFCFQGQVNILLISIFGSTQSIAEVGALGRLSVIFLIINSLMTTVVLPGFARCQDIPTLRRRYFQILASFLTLGVLLILITACFPDIVLSLLGKKYSHLGDSLVLMVTSTVTTSIIGVMSMMNQTKAWVEYIWVEIPIRLLLQVVLLLTLDLSTVNGVLIFGLLSNFSPLIINAFLSLQGFRKASLFSF